MTRFSQYPSSSQAGPFLFRVIQFYFMCTDIDASCVFQDDMVYDYEELDENYQEIEEAVEEVQLPISLERKLTKLSHFHSPSSSSYELITHSIQNFGKKA